MRLYHGSSMRVETPDVSFSKRNLDFGRGFYLTRYQSQAERWAERKTMRHGGKPIVTVYELNDDLGTYSTLTFEDDATWVEFVCACRRGSESYQKYDVIIGSVANDKVYTAVEMFYKGLWGIDQTLAALKFYELNDQVCIINQAIIDECLHFVDAYEVS